MQVPHDLVNEQVIVAAALAGGKARQLPRSLPVELFVDDAHAALWQGMRTLLQEGAEVDAAALAREVAGEVDAAYVRELLESYPRPPANLARHIANLRWDAARADVVRGPLSDLLRALQDPTAPPERVRALAAAVERGLAQGADAGRLTRPAAALVREQMAEVDRRAHHAFYPYGIDGLDRDEAGAERMIPGCAPRDCTVITGVSGSAKSVSTARIVLEQARLQRRVLYGAWEMGAGDTLELLALMSLAEQDRKWTRRKIKLAQMNADEREQLRERMDAIASFVTFFDVPLKGQRRGGRKGAADNDDRLDVIHQAVADSAAEVVALDLWERAIPDRSPEAEANALFRTQEIAQITGAHFLLVGQQRLKDIEKRDDVRPTREGIKGSAAWVEVGDTILGFHRPALFSNTPDTEIWIRCLKQRRGRWPFEIRCDWDGDRCQFANGREVEFAKAGGGRNNPFKEFTEGR